MLGRRNLHPPTRYDRDERVPVRERGIAKGERGRRLGDPHQVWGQSRTEHNEKEGDRPMLRSAASGQAGWLSTSERASANPLASAPAERQSPQGLHSGSSYPYPPGHPEHPLTTSIGHGGRTQVAPLLFYTDTGQPLVCPQCRRTSHPAPRPHVELVLLALAWLSFGLCVRT